MNLSMIVQPALVAVNEDLQSGDAVLQRIAELTAPEMPVDADTILSALQDREKVGSTGFGSGIAIPHCRLEEATRFDVGLLVLAKGIDFDSTDGEPVRIFAFIVGPESEPTRHLKVLSALSLALSSEPVREALLQATTSEQAIEAIGMETRASVVREPQTRKRLFHVAVQDESLFERLLEVFEGIESANITVVETHNTATYLARLPLFSSLLGDSPETFNRLIIATVAREISNETVRRIEIVTGPLDDRSDVMVVVQDTHFVAGGLSV